MAAPEPAHDKSALQFERLVFFSDAVFAIAITLLVLELRLPEEAHGHIDWGLLFPKLLGFGISFYVIGIYWLVHHRLFGTLRRENGALLRANLAFLASIAFLPFPTTVISQGRPTTEAVVFYAVSAAAVGLLLLHLGWVARREPLMAPGESKGGTRHFLIRSSAAPLVFLASIPVAFFAPTLASFCWIAIWPAVMVAERIGRAAERRLDARGA